MLANLANDVVCNQPTAVGNFDMTKLAGDWYEQQHTKTPNEMSMSCSESQYGTPTADADDASLMDFKITESYQTEFMGHWTPRLSIGAKGKCDTSGNCYFSYFGKKVDTPNMIVVDTDYDNYTIMYSCDTANNQETVWLNSRDPQMSDDAFNAMYAKA